MNSHLSDLSTVIFLRHERGGDSRMFYRILEFVTAVLSTSQMRAHYPHRPGIQGSWVMSHHSLTHALQTRQDAHEMDGLPNKNVHYSGSSQDSKQGLITRQK